MQFMVNIAAVDLFNDAAPAFAATSVTRRTTVEAFFDYYHDKPHLCRCRSVRFRLVVNGRRVVFSQSPRLTRRWSDDRGILRKVAPKHRPALQAWLIQQQQGEQK